MCNSISFSGDSLQGATSIAIARTTSRVAGATFARNCTAKEFFLGEETETWDQIMLGTSSIQTQNPRFPENKYDRDSVYCQIDQRT